MADDVQPIALGSLEEYQVEMSKIGDKQGTLTDAEVLRFSGLEQGMEAFRASQEVKARSKAYNMPRVSIQPASVIQGSRDDGRYTTDKYLRGDKGAAKEMASYSQWDRRTAGNELEGQAKLFAWPREGQTYEQYAQTETTTGGGYLVPTVTEKVMVIVTKAFGGLSAKASHINTSSGDPINFPSVDDTANVAALAAINAAPASAGADLVFGTVTLGAWKYAATGTGQLGLKVPRELIDDSLFDITGLVTELLGVRLARQMAADYTQGIGTTAPVGLFHFTSPSVNAAIPTTGLVQATANASLEAQIHLLDPSYVNENCCWIMNWATHGIIAGFVDSTNRPLMVPYAAAGLGSPPAYTLIGFPVVIDQGCPAFSLTNATNPAGVNTAYAAFGDFSQAFLIRDVQGIGIAVDPYTGIGSNQVLYFGYARTDSNVKNAKAYNLLAGYHV